MRRTACCALAAAVLVCAAHTAAAAVVTLTPNTPITQTATNAVSTFEYQFELSSTYVFGELVASFPDGVSDIATMKVSTTGIPTAATPCGGGSGSTCVADNDDDSSDGDVYADLPSSFFGKTVFAYVSVQFASASGTMDFTIEAVGHAATVLELNEAVSVDPRQSKGALSRQQMFKVAIDGGATPTAVVTMNSLVSSASMYIGTNIVPTTSTFSFRGDDDLGFDQKYQAELSNDGTSYILIVTTAPYSIEVEQSPLTGTQIAIVTLAVLAVVTVGCFCVGRKTCARAVDSDEVLRINSYMCFFVGAMVCIGPAIMFIVGMSMADVAPTVGVILPAIGGSVVAITLFFTGPTSVELNAKTQLCTIKRFYLIVWPLRTNSYPLNTIEHFYTTTHYSRNKNGGTSVTYAAHMKLKNGSSVKVDAANSNVGGFRNCVERFNAFLRKADPSTQRNAATVGGINPLVAAVTNNVQQNMQMRMMQAQMQQQQMMMAQQQAALAAQQQAAMTAQQMNMGGPGGQPAYTPQAGYTPQPAYTPQSGAGFGGQGSNLPPPSAAATGGYAYAGAQLPTPSSYGQPTMPPPSAPPSRSRNAPPRPPVSRNTSRNTTYDDPSAFGDGKPRRDGKGGGPDVML